jgi:hypothetical protein
MSVVRLLSADLGVYQPCTETAPVLGRRTLIWAHPGPVGDRPGQIDQRTGLNTA